jgi:hypothetical protein
VPSILDLTKGQVTTLLTLFVATLWAITAVARIWVPFPAAYVLDAAMPVIVAYYFISKNGYKANGATPP